MKSSALLILFEILVLCHTIYGDINSENPSDISNDIKKSGRHRLHDSQPLLKDEKYQQDKEHKINDNERQDKLSQSNSENEIHDKPALQNDNVPEVSSNTKLGPKIKRRFREMTTNSNKNNESEDAKIRDVRSSNRDHIHDRRDSSNDENRGIFGASGGLSGGLGGNIGDASAGTEFGIKFNGGIGRN